jgi:ubiquinone/menaquinone biosynthesis C-methylase UbiE
MRRAWTRDRREVSVNNSLRERVERERSFWDELATKQQLPATRTWIARAKAGLDRHADVHDYYDPRGKHVLDYGCGDGELTLELLRRGAARVTAFDLSRELVEVARARLAKHGLADRAELLVADAHDLDFPDESFELAVGIAILHHLDLRVALPGLRRILKPGGRAVFVEPLWHNPVLRIGRALTPSARTPDEHPLTVQDWALCASIFPRFEHHERDLTTTLLLPVNLVLPHSARRSLATRLGRFDDRLLGRFSFLRRYARLSILLLEK